MSTLPMHRGQISTEFVTILVFTLIIFSVYYSVVSFQYTQAVSTFRDIQAETIVERTTATLDLVLSQNTNVTWNMYLPPQIAKADYNISLSDTGNATLAVVDINGNTIIERSAAPRTEGNISQGHNTVENRGGVLHVSQP